MRAFIYCLSLGTRNNDQLSISQLFADDTLIFRGVASDICLYLSCLLLCFETASWLKINLAKFELVLVGRMWMVWFVF
jgi:hypothetical protein